MPAPMEFLLLGPLEVRGADGVARRLGSIKHRMLLAKLLLRANQLVPADELIAMIWGDEQPPTVRQSLLNMIAALRRVIEPESPAKRAQTLVRLGPGYSLELDPDQLDLHRFTCSAEQGRRALGEGDAAAAAVHLHRALALWRGPVLVDVVAEAGITWPELAGIDEQRVVTREARIEADLALGRHAALVGELAALIRMYPLREHLRGQLMLALYRSGRQAEALAAYQAARQTLVEELGIEPGIELQRLEQAILAQDRSLELLAPAAVATGSAVGWDSAPELLPVAGQPSTPMTAGPERRLLTVLVVDVDEPAQTAEERDPEDVSDVLAAYLERVGEQVEAFGGSVEHSLGGSTLAVFGLPVTREDDPERAVRAALAIRDALQPSRSTSDQDGRRGLEVRGAVATGEALVKAEPGSGRLVGELIAAAFRLLQAAPDGAVLVTETTGRATERAISYGPPSLLSLRGRATPMVVWSALETRSRGVDLSQPPEVPLVGRTEELAVLREAFEQVCATQVPRLVTVIGEPGIGKTRLVLELARLLEVAPELVAWRVGHSLPYGEATSFWALREIVKAQAGILGTDTIERAERKLAHTVRDTLGTDQAAASWVLGHLRPLVDLGDEAQAPPAGRRAEAFAAWRRFLLGLATARPLVLLLEDLHWADDALLDFIDSLVGPAAARQPASLLVLATGRPKLLERWPSWAAGSSARTTIRLGPLSTAESMRLLRALLARHDLPGTVGETLVASVGGSPLFAEEYVRMLRDRRPSTVSNGAGGERSLAAVAPASGKLPLPTSVHAIIAARLDTLPAGEKAVLQDAAVLGRVGWTDALAAVGGHDREPLEGCLDRLVDREFLRWVRRSSVAGEREYEFRHVLVQDVAYGQIPRAQRAGRHRRAAGWLERITTGPADGLRPAAARTVDPAELLAQHYQRALLYAPAGGAQDGDLIQQARLALRTAGDRAAALRVPATAARYYLDALALWPARDPFRPELEFRAGTALSAAEGHDQDLLARARDGFLAADDRERAAEAEARLGQLAFMRGERERAAHMDRALALVADAPMSAARANVLKEQMQHLFVADCHDEALGLAREVLAIARQLGLREVQAAALETIGAARVNLGDRGGLEDLERSTAICEEIGSERLPGNWINLASLFSLLGELDRCYAAAAAAQDTAERFGLLRETRWVQMDQTGHHYWQGQWDQAVAVANRFLDQEYSDTTHYMDTPCRIWRGRIRLAKGATNQAVADALRALEMARTCGDLQNLQPALAFAARALLAAGRANEAAAFVDELVRSLHPVLLKADLSVDLGVVLIAFGYPAAVLDDLPPSPWLEAARAFVAGDPGHAAQAYAQIGSRPDEAYARLEASRRHPEQPGGRADLDAAVTFYRQVGANAYLRQAEAVSLGV